jgi:predicted nucleic acid-binding protein
MIVVDTNTLAYLYLNSDESAQAEQLLTLEPEWIAPRLWKSEFRNILALYLRRAILSIEDRAANSQTSRKPDARQ